MAFVESALTFSTTGAIAYPALHKKIVELAMPMLVVKKLLPEFPLVAGKTATFVKEAGSRSAAISESSEGAEIQMDFTPLTTVVVTPYKKGLRERISQENIEDLYIPVIEGQLRRIARRMAYTIDKDCMTVIDAASVTSNACTGKSLSATGTEYTIASTVGSKDILAARSAIRGYNLEPDTVLLNPVNERDVLYLPQFTMYSEYGDPNTALQTGLIGKVYGMNVFTSNVVPAGTAYVVSTGQNISSAYSPLGFFVIKRPLMTRVAFKDEFDCFDVTLTTRYSPVVTVGEAIAKITGLATS